MGATYKLTFDEYVDSVKQLSPTWFFVASSSRPSGRREVRVMPNGSMVCSCPSRKKCVHVKAIETFLAPVEVVIAAPCSCSMCRSGNPYCKRNFGGNDWQIMQAIGC